MLNPLTKSNIHSGGLMFIYSMNLLISKSNLMSLISNYFFWRNLNWNGYGYYIVVTTAGIL